MINIAELLKDAPEGIELWFTLYGKVKLISVNFYESYPIQIRLNDNTVEKLDKYGRYFNHYEDAECVLFPSKDCRTWEGWQTPVEHKFKVGDWITDGHCICQISSIDSRYWYSETCVLGNIISIDKTFHLWTVQDAKDGDVLVSGIGNPFIYNSTYKNVESSFIGSYVGVSRNGEIRLDLFPSKAWTSVKDVKPATKEQRNLLFAKMREAGYQWDADKKELRKIKPHYDIANFKPFDKVLVRESNRSTWAIDFYGFVDEDNLFICSGYGYYPQCIPFEGNEHLLGTTDMPDERFINW